MTTRPRQTRLALYTLPKRAHFEIRAILKRGRNGVPHERIDGANVFRAAVHTEVGEMSARDNEAGCRAVAERFTAFTFVGTDAAREHIGNFSDALTEASAVTRARGEEEACGKRLGEADEGFEYGGVFVCVARCCDVPFVKRGVRQECCVFDEHGIDTCSATREEEDVFVIGETF